MREDNVQLAIPVRLTPVRKRPRMMQQTLTAVRQEGVQPSDGAYGWEWYTTEDDTTLDDPAIASAIGEKKTFKDGELNNVTEGAVVRAMDGKRYKARRVIVVDIPRTSVTPPPVPEARVQPSMQEHLLGLLHLNAIAFFVRGHKISNLFTFDDVVVEEPSEGSGLYTRVSFAVFQPYDAVKNEVYIPSANDLFHNKDSLRLTLQPEYFTPRIYSVFYHKLVPVLHYTNVRINCDRMPSFDSFDSLPNIDSTCHYRPKIPARYKGTYVTDELPGGTSCNFYADNDLQTRVNALYLNFKDMCIQYDDDDTCYVVRFGFALSTRYNENKSNSQMDLRIDNARIRNLEACERVLNECIPFVQHTTHLFDDDHYELQDQYLYEDFADFSTITKMYDDVFRKTYTIPMLTSVQDLRLFGNLLTRMDRVKNLDLTQFGTAGTVVSRILHIPDDDNVVDREFPNVNIKEFKGFMTDDFTLPQFVSEDTGKAFKDILLHPSIWDVVKDEAAFINNKMDMYKAHMYARYACTVAAFYWFEWNRTFGPPNRSLKARSMYAAFSQ